MKPRVFVTRCLPAPVLARLGEACDYQIGAEHEAPSRAALLAGLAAGAALGILFAPDSGEETRDKLSESLKKLGDSIKETAATEIDNLVGLKDKVVSSIKTKVNGAEEEYQDDLEHA